MIADLLDALAKTDPQIAVVRSQDIPDRYCGSTMRPFYRPPCLLLPSSRHQLQIIVKLAAAHQVSLYVFSTGRNWGYGNAQSVKQDAVLVSLEKLNRILEVDAELGYAVVEPGVTQRQFYEYLQANQIPLIYDVTGAGPNTSIIGNLLERGFGHTPLADKVANSCAYEVLLPNGSYLKTGFGDYATNDCIHLYKHGIGPSLDGLFAQSGLGIVTQATIWLSPKPTYMGLVLLQAKTNQQLQDAVSSLRNLRATGTLASPLHFGNDLRLISSRMQSPVQGRRRLNEQERQQLRQECGVDLWSGLSAYYGDRCGFRYFKNKVRKSLRGKLRVRFIGQYQLSMIIEVCNFLRRYSFFSKRFRRLWVAVDSLIAVSNLLKGKPSSTFLNAVVWSVEDQTTQVDETTFSDVAGLYWVSPLIPFRDSDLQNAQSIIDDVLSRYDFDTAVTYSLISSRCIQGIVSIHFDKRNQQATQRAKDAYESLTAALLEAGYPPYRLNVDSMHFFQKYSRTYLETMQALKAAIDPLGHMMGGRYQPKLSSDVP